MNEVDIASARVLDDLGEPPLRSSAVTSFNKYLDSDEVGEVLPRKARQDLRERLRQPLLTARERRVPRMARSGWFPSREAARSHRSMEDRGSSGEL